MDIEVIRGIERLVIVTFSGASIFLGWNLFRVGVVDPQSASFSGQGYKFTLQKAGPGIFFALFGSAVLSVALINGLTYSSIKSDEKSSLTILYAGEQRSELRMVAQSINTLSLIDMDKLSMTPAKKKRINKAINNLQGHRDNLVRHVFGKEKVDQYKKCHSLDTSNVCRNTDTFKEIESWRNGTY